LRRLSGPAALSQSYISILTRFFLFPHQSVLFLTSQEKAVGAAFLLLPFEMGDSQLMTICSVGGNPVSAFLSWRLQATNACDVTLVWKSGYEHVAQYGISFKYVVNCRYLGQVITCKEGRNNLQQMCRS
jgi:hypothetical protein